MHDDDDDGYEHEEARPGESHGETLARALGNAERRAAADGGEVRGVIVLTLIACPPTDEEGHPDPDWNVSNGATERLMCDATPGMGASRRMGALLWALDVERAS